MATLMSGSAAEVAADQAFPDGYGADGPPRAEAAFAAMAGGSADSAADGSMANAGDWHAAGGNFDSGEGPLDPGAAKGMDNGMAWGADGNGMAWGADGNGMAGAASWGFQGYGNRSSPY